jgi:hypothetical protein
MGSASPGLVTSGFIHPLCFLKVLIWTACSDKQHPLQHSVLEESRAVLGLRYKVHCCVVCQETHCLNTTRVCISQPLYTAVCHLNLFHTFTPCNNIRPVLILSCTPTSLKRPLIQKFPAPKLCPYFLFRMREPQSKIIFLGGEFRSSLCISFPPCSNPSPYIWTITAFLEKEADGTITWSDN